MAGYNLVGQKFGKLLVMERAPIPPNAKVVGRYWKCICDCPSANIKIIFSAHLVSGSVKSCGCLRDIKTKDEAILSSANSVYRNYKDGDLSLSDFISISQFNCHYCGIKPIQERNIFAKDNRSTQFASQNGLFTYNGLDRINSNIGHYKNNCVPCCKTCNYFKLNSLYEDIINKINNFNIKINNLENQFLIRDQLSTIIPTNKKISKLFFINNKLPRILKDRIRMMKNRYEILISREEIAELICGICSYCQEKANILNNNFIGIDRIKNNIGYTIENSISCCRNCNVGKKDMSFSDFSEWIIRIKNNINNIPKLARLIDFSFYYN